MTSGEMEPWLWGRLAETGRRLPAGYLRGLAGAWQDLQKENAPLRAVVNGRLVSLPEDGYDPFLRRVIAAQPAEFSAAQAAGRLESKRVMKHRAYADLFRMMFEFWLAYGDEPRPVTYKDAQGHTQYQQFNRYDFLERDEDGAYYWNDQFLFSVDTTDTLANNREAMWQETRQNLQTGAFGDPAATETLILFWTKMEQLHYPGAGETKQALEHRAQREARMGEEYILTQGNREKMPDQSGEEGRK